MPKPKPRKRSAAETAKREKKFRKHLAKRNNPVRGTIVLPADLKLEDVDWNASAAERGFAKLAELDREFEKQELAHLRQRCKALQEIVDADRAWLKKAE